MSSNLHLEGQTTKKYSLPLTHLDYGYIEKCTNVKELEKIIRVLRSGEEGKFPDLERFAEKRLEKLDPKSRSLRKEGPILRPGDLSSGDWQNIEEDLKSWSSSMNEKDSKVTVKSAKTEEIIVEGDENLPPVRSTNVVLEGKKLKKAGDEKKKKRVLPRDYKEWEKVDIDAELNKVDDTPEKKEQPKKSGINGVTLDIDATGLSNEEKEMKANREKDKGNEAFRSHDFEESVTYYSRSISLTPSAASFNNRALAYLKLEKWDKAIKDCNSVLNLEADNIKALLRRGTAYKSKKDFKKANLDFEKVLQLEPNNKKAEDLLEEVSKAITKDEKERKEKGGGRRMVIQEVESSDEEGEIEIEVEKPIVNGKGKHDKTSDNNKVKSDSTEQSSHSKISNGTTNSQPSTGAQPDPQPSTGAKPESKSSSSKPSLESQEKVSAAPHKSEATNNFSTKELSMPSQDATKCSTPNNFPPNPISSKDSSALPPTTRLSSDPSSHHLQQPSESGSTESSSKVSFTLDNSTAEEGQASESSPSAAEQTQASATTTTDHQFTRPQFVQLPLPPKILKIKEEGNSLFRSGQYGEAIEVYSKAVVALEKESGQRVNLSQLLSNRAACHLKTGNCSQAIKDCQVSLQHLPHAVKSLLRRAAAYEATEKYAEAYVDYKHVISIDRSADQAHQGATRCQSVLQQQFGFKVWRDKIPPLIHVHPWEVPLIVDQAGMHKSLSSTVSLSAQDGASKPASTPSQEPTAVPSSTIQQEPQGSAKTTSKQQENSIQQPQENSKQPQKSTKEQSQAPPQRTKEQEFEEMKAKGNQHVQKGQYQEAAKYYSTCIALQPEQVASYTNRALCYLKLNKNIEAEADCDKALSLQTNNPKALYRRALARKMCGQFKQSLQDLIELLKLEPKNTAAQKEMDIVKKAYKEEFDKMKQKKAAEQETKVRKRMKIEEVDDEEEEEKPTRGKAADKSKSQTKSRGGKMAQPSPGNKSKTDKRSSQPQEASVQAQPVAPPIAPRLMKTTPYEFCQAWNSLKPCQGIQPYAEILRQVSPVDLPSVISNKLDGQMLQIIVRCVYEEMVLKGEGDTGYQILDNLCKVPRFSTVSMFMSGKEKKEVSGVLDILSKTSSSAYTSADITRLKKEYSVK